MLTEGKVALAPDEDAARIAAENPQAFERQTIDGLRFGSVTPNAEAYAPKELCGAPDPDPEGDILAGHVDVAGGLAKSWPKPVLSLRPETPELPRFRSFLKTWASRLL